MSTLLDGLTTALLTYGAHSAVACCLALAASRVIRRPQDRDIVWKSALIAPLFTAAAAVLVNALADRGPFIDVVDLVRRVSHLRLPGREIMVRIIDRGDGPNVVRHFADPVATVLSALSVGASFCLVTVAVIRLANRRRAWSRALAHRRPVRDLAGIGGTVVRLSAADDLQSPVAFGAAEICLPADVLSDFSDAHTHSLITHEVAHLERRDPAWFLVAEIIAALSAFQPLIFVVTRAFRRDVELICDETALHRTHDRSSLIGALARLASPFDPRAPRYGAATAYDGSPLVARAERIATLPMPMAPRRARRHVVLGVAVIVALLCAIPVFSSVPRLSDLPTNPLDATRRAGAMGRIVTIDSTVAVGDHIRRMIVRVN